MEVIKKYTSEEVEHLRYDYLKRFVCPKIYHTFLKYPKINSIIMILGHFELPASDEELHVHLLFSKDSNPDISSWFREREGKWRGLLTYTGSVDWFIGGKDEACAAEFEFDVRGEPVPKRYEFYVGGGSEVYKLALFSAYCEEGDRDLGPQYNYSPYGIFQRIERKRKITRRKRNPSFVDLQMIAKQVSVKIIGVQHRPWLNGVIAAEKEKELKKYSTQEAAKLRTIFIRNEVVPMIKSVFEKFPRIKAVVFLTAQYWDDEADDAVHPLFLLCKNENPDLDLWFEHPYDNSDFLFMDETVDKNLEEMFDVFRWHGPGGWQENYDSIPLFAAFCKEGAWQDEDYADSYLPYAIFRRGLNNSVTTEVVGKMIRPWLDGVMPEWEARK